MNVKNNIKKVFAIAASAALVGTTLVGALAYDLSSYPAPFVENGIMNGAIVVGANAATTDVLGAIDIAASLQAEAVTPVSSTGASATTTVQGGMLIEDNANQDLNFGDNVTSTSFDDEDLVILADGTLSDDDGSSVDYTQVLSINYFDFDFSNPNSNVYDKPELFLDTTSSPNTDLVYTLDFDSSVDFTTFEDSESFDMFGKAFTIKKLSSSTDDLILYASDLSEIVTMGTPLTVTVDGVEHTIEIMGANSNGAVVNLAVDGDTRSMTEGNTKTISGVEIYVQEVFISNVAGESAAAKIFVGSQEWNLGNGGSQDLKINNDRIDGVKVNVDGSNLSSVDKLVFTVSPKDIKNAETTKDFDWLVSGETFVDPIFGFKLDFTEAVPSIDSSSKGLVDLKASSNNVDLTFTNANSVDYSFELYKYNSGEEFGEHFTPLNTTGVILNEDMTFIATDDYLSNHPVSAILRVVDIYNDTVEKVDFEDISTGKSYTGIKLNENIKNLNVQVTGIDSTLATETVTLKVLGTGYTGVELYTKNNYQLSFDADPTTSNDLSIKEDAKGVNHDETGVANPSAYTISIDYVGSTSNEWQISDSTFDNRHSDTANSVIYSLTNYGTYAERDDDDSWMKVYTLDEEMDLNVYVSAPDAVTVTSAATGSSYIVNPIALGLGVLDTDVTLGAKPMIIVGGPYANSIAADFLGNPSDEEIMATFTAGKAMIKYDDANKAMLVAGYSAQDTQGASYVVANHNLYDFSGNELEVVVTDLNNIVVN